MSSITKEEGRWMVYLTPLGVPTQTHLPTWRQDEIGAEDIFLGDFETIAEAAEALIAGVNAQSVEAMRERAAHIEALQTEVSTRQVRLLIAEKQAEQLGAALVGLNAKKPTFRQIRRFYAACAARGLNPKRRAALRDALSCYFNREFGCLGEVSAEQWSVATGAVSGRNLRW